MPTGAADVPRGAFDGDGGENPYTVHADLQQMMNDLVASSATEELERHCAARGVKSRAKRSASSVQGVQPGWHLAIDLSNMLLVSECVARAALI